MASLVAISDSQAPTRTAAAPIISVAATNIVRINAHCTKTTPSRCCLTTCVSAAARLLSAPHRLQVQLRPRSFNNEFI